MGKQDLAIIFSGSIGSLALYTLSAVGKHPDIPSPRMIHLLCMQNGASRFSDFAIKRYKTVEKILKAQMPTSDPLPEASFVDLDTTRLFQDLWLDQYEVLMPQFGGKNLLCTACRFATHMRAIIYCVERLVPLFIVGHSGKLSGCPKHSEAFMAKATALSSAFGITSRFPMHRDFDDENIIKHLLEDHGLPSDSGGKIKCLFSHTNTTATEKEIESYLDHMMPRVTQYVESRLEGDIKGTAVRFA